MNAILSSLNLPASLATVTLFPLNEPAHIAFEVSSSAVAWGVGGLAVGLLLVGFMRRRTGRAIRTLTNAVQRVSSSSDEFVLPDGMPPSVRPLAESLILSWERLRSTLARAERERDGAVAVLSRIADGVVVTDSRGKVTFINRTELARLRVSESRVLGHSFIEVLKDHEMHSMLRECLATRSEVRGVVETAPGRRYFGVTATPLEDSGGCVVVLQDLTELRRLEKVRRDFVANISHELRTPLASLKLLAETLETGGADDIELVHDYVNRIGLEVDRLAQMVDELGELTLIETGQVALQRAPIRVSTLVMRAAARLEAQAVRAGLRLETDIPEGLPEPRGDERRLEQVLVNLMHNAIKFTPVSGGIVLSARADGASVVISVKDTGVGIAEDELERIFERFYKVDKSRSGRGTGLGLAIARHTVEAHGGVLWVESVEGRGSTFSFSLPLGD